MRDFYQEYNQPITNILRSTMPTVNKFIIAVVLLSLRLTTVTAQTTTVLDQTLLTQDSFNTFTPVSVTGFQSWYFLAPYGAVCNGYSGGQSFENEDWLISPVMNLSQMDNVQLTFEHTRGNTAVMNVGVSQGWYKAFATASYTGNPATTQWTELTPLNQNLTTAWEFISSGALVIPDAAKSQNSRIAFRYISSAAQSAMWEIKNMKVTGEPENSNPGGSGGSFKITNWNIAWFGCTTEGPTNENLQLSNVATAMLSMNSDIYCIQEVSNTPINPTMDALVAALGSNQWGGAIVPSNTGDCNQRQAIIYKKSRVQYVSSFEMSTGNAAQGNSYYFNWSSGRFPALYNVNLISGNTMVPVTIVNLHAKAEDGNAMSYTRRKGGSEALKTILDGAAYNSKNVIITGDFNDYLIGTTSNSCGCTVSPYKNFMDDTADYMGITQSIIDINPSWGTEPIIEHIIISNELTDNYSTNSAVQEVGVTQSIPNFYNTTSNHVPVSATFQFPVLGTEEIVREEKSWTLYPNPVKDVVYITGNDTIDAVTIYTLQGQKVFEQTIAAASDNSVNIAGLPAGSYIVNVNSESAVKSFMILKQ